jgi:formate hydrogenlyase transcriptional activator
MGITNHNEASQQLTRSDDRLWLLLDTTPALIHTGLPDGSLDFFNRRWLEYVGLSLTDLLGWRWTNAIHPEDVGELVAAWRAALETGEPLEAESRVRRADGEYRWFLHRKVPLRDEVGSIIKWYGSSIEIEDRKRAEETIRRDERELQQQIDFIPQLVCVFDANGQILQANQMVLNYTGRTLEEFLKGDGARKSLHPDDLASYWETRLRGISRGLPFENEARLLERNGQYSWFLFRFNPLRDETGDILRWYATATNIEEMKRADEGLRRAIEELQGKQELLDLAQEAAHVVAFEWYPQNEVNVWSPEHAALYGQPSCSLDVTYQSWKKLVHPKDWPLVLGFIKHAQETGEVSSEFRVVWPDGSIHWLAANGQMFFDDVGQPCRIVGFTGEITPRKLIEEELLRTKEDLRASEASFRLIVDSIPGLVHTTTAEGKLEFVNRQLLDYFGKTLDELKGWATNDVIHPDDRSHVIAAFTRSIETGQTYDIEQRCRRKDGVYRWFHVRALAVRDKEGRIIRWYTLFTDIDERKQAEEALRQDERELRQLIDFLPQLVMVLAADGNLLLVNQMVVDYTGYTMREMGEMGTDERRARDIHPDDLERALSEWQRGLASEAQFELERRARGKDGRYRWFLFRHKPLLDKEGRVARWFVTATDIEERKQEEEGIRKENIALREEIVKASMFEEIVGASPVLQAVLTLVAKVAPTDSTVLITGETGTGKELIARAIHNRSRRSARAFVSVNCAAIPPPLIASELFGHEKGAFTGATQRRLGRFELAEGGTIFLDEIGELSAETQVTLLRVLQEHEFERVGGNSSIRANVRVIVATNRDLEAAMTAGTFRSDLFYRLNVFPIEMPALRERREDIPLLVEYFIDRFARKAGKRIRRINKKTLELLQSYPWPGNIRELQNVIERSVIVCEGEDFSVDESWLSRQPVATELQGQIELSQRLAAHEKEAIEAALSESGGRVFGPSGAAAKLGIPRSTLESKIRSLKINKNRFKIADPSKDN